MRARIIPIGAAMRWQRWPYELYEEKPCINSPHPPITAPIFTISFVAASTCLLLILALVCVGMRFHYNARDWKSFDANARGNNR